MTTTSKSFKPIGKDVRYLNRDFASLKADLFNLAKTYYPNTYKDFSDASPGTMFMEQAAYVGDVLSYYIDQTFKEGNINNSSERKNVISLSNGLGYKIKPKKAATATIEIFQLCPAIQSDTGEWVPDPKYILSLKEHSQFSNSNNAYYIVEDPIDFSVDTKLSPRTTSIYSRTNVGLPEFFLLGKQAIVSSGKIVTRDFVIGEIQPFLKITLDEDNVLKILSIKDSDNNSWYEVDYLAQEMVLTEVPNDVMFEGNLSQYKQEVPYILKHLKTPKRFIVNVDENNMTTIGFGPGTEGCTEEIVNLSSQTVGVGLSGVNKLRLPFDPSNFLKNQSYGISPSNTKLTISYVIGGGISSNCPSGDIRKITFVDIENSFDGLTIDESNMLNTVRNSLKVNNITPATGGLDAEPTEQIKLNAVSNFAAQSRSVTKDDYLVRIYSLPSRYGSVAKAQVVTNNSLTVNTNRYVSGVILDDGVTTVDNSGHRKITYDVSNPFSINLYVLSYDDNKNLTPINEALTANLIKYLKQYRMMTDGINIIDGYIINIGVEFSVILYKGYNKKDVMKKCIETVKSFFDIDLWNFSQPINLSQLELELAKTEGVQSIVDVKVVNKTIKDGNYSAVEYDIKSATKNKIIYPSLDPSCWEIKYPNVDIKANIL